MAADAAPMTMNRVIHAAVRRDLARLDEALASAPDGDRERAADLLRAYDNLLRELTHHHEGEDEIIFPALGDLDVDPALIEEMEAEHQAMADALRTTRAALQVYASTGSAADAAAARESAVTLRHVVDRHLTHEEQELEPLIIPLIESPQWKVVEKKLRSQPPGVAGRFFAWVQDGMDERSRTFLAGTVPGPVRWLLSHVLGRAYHREIAPVWR